MIMTSSFMSTRPTLASRLVSYYVGGAHRYLLICVARNPQLGLRIGDATKRTLVDIATCQRRGRLPPLTTLGVHCREYQVGCGFSKPRRTSRGFSSRNATLLRLFQHEFDFLSSYDRSRPFFLYRSQSDPTGMKLLSRSLSRSTRLDTRNPEPLTSALDH